MEATGDRSAVTERRWLNLGSVGFAAQTALHATAALAEPGSGTQILAMVPATLGPMFLLGAFIGPIIEPMHERTVKKLAASGALLLVGGVATMVGTLGAEAHAVCAGLAAFATAWCAMNPTPRYTGYIRGGLPVYEDGSGPAG